LLIKLTPAGQSCGLDVGQLDEEARPVELDIVAVIVVVAVTVAVVVLVMFMHAELLVLVVEAVVGVY
jgi:uncharacterized protein (DUF983 family)